MRSHSETPGDAKALRPNSSRSKGKIGVNNEGYKTERNHINNLGLQ